MSKDLSEILIYGAGGFARETAWLLDSSDGPAQPLAFINDDAQLGDTLRDLPVLDLKSAIAQYPKALICVSVANPAVREKIASKLKSSHFILTTIMHSSVLVDQSVTIGCGSIICAGNLIMPDVSIGQHVHINLSCTIGHDCIIEDFVTISPGVNLSGNVHIGKGAFIGTGATFVQGTEENPLIIGAGSVIGAGACVTKNTEPNGVYVGVPAIRKN